MQYISVCRRQPVPRLPHLFPNSGISTADGSPFDGIYLRIGATNCDAETRGELRVFTAVLAFQLPQLSDVHIPRSVVIKLVVHGFVVKRRLFPVEG
jgi:hypothetical protein